MKTIGILILLVFFCVACTSDDMALDTGSEYENSILGILESMNMDRPHDSYNYPVYPGTAQWTKFTSGQQMRDACQVPTSVLEKMSTPAVIQAIWEHPLLFDVFHRYQYQMDFEALFLGNNAYRELCGRKDAVALLTQYLDVVNPVTNSVLDVGPYILELLLVQDELQSQLDEKEMEALIQIILKNDKIRQQDPEPAIRRKEWAISWLLLGKMMATSGYEPFVKELENDQQLNSFVNSRTHSYIDVPEREEKVRQTIIQFARSFLLML